MDSDEILYPPFPSLQTTTSKLLDTLDKLRKFLLENRFLANEQYLALGYEGELIPAVEYLPVIPDLSRYQVISIVDTFQTYTALRRLRCDWDEMVREYEECWLAKPAIVARLRLLYRGVSILVEAFVTPEVREARRETFAKRVQDYQNAFMDKLGIPPEMRPHTRIVTDSEGVQIDTTEPQAEDIDFDKLFHGDPDEPGDPPSEESPGGDPDARG